MNDETIEQVIEIATPDGTADGVLYRPATGDRWPGVMHLVDAGGIRPAQTDMAKRLAGEGYVVLMPNVFYRTSKTPLFSEFPMKIGDERTTRRFMELLAPLTAGAMQRDGAAYTDFLASHDSVNNGPVGVVGYCATGSMALRTAAIRPDKVGAAASFHGGRLFTDAPDSPHTALPQIKARLYFGHAVDDKSMPKEAIENLGHALKAWGGTYENEVYEGSYHSWTALDSPVYNRAQADRAFEKLLELFDATLK
jgi:carboxymethylenebutenolidase